MTQKCVLLHRKGKIVVFTNGCFDILHRGHIEVLTKAKLEGDYLMVGINGDDSVRRLKGEGRPIQSELDRAVIVDTLAPVDDVTIFYEETPERLIKLVRPDVLVKGADYHGDEIAGASAVRENGGRVVRVARVENRASSQIIEKIVCAYRAKTVE